jgi:signal peptide peptidase SppA
MTNFLHIADRLFGQPLFLEPGKAKVIVDVLQARGVGGLGAVQHGAEIEVEATVDPDANRLNGSYRRENRPSGLSRKIGTSALITVDGSLVNRGAYIGASSGVTSYEGLTAQVNDATADNEIEQIILDMNSHGGEAHGMWALVGAIHRARKTKRVVALINDVAYSAGYAIASAADEIVISETSGLGSIGVVMVHADHSAELEEAGIKPTMIFSGANKVDGNPFEPLPESVRADFQKQSDAFYDRFTAMVGKGRGSRLTQARARATEARTFLGREAIEMGLADRVGTLESIIAKPKRPASAAAKKGATRMSNENETVTAEDHQSAVAAARQEGMDAGTAAATTRISAILTASEAEGREATARTLALETSMSADEAVKVLSTTPAAPAPKGPETIEERADGAELGGGDEGSPKAKGDLSVLSGAVDNLNKRRAR